MSLTKYNVRPIFSYAQATNVHITAIGLLWHRLNNTVGSNSAFDTQQHIPELDVVDPKFSFLGGYNKVCTYHFAFHG